MKSLTHLAVVLVSVILLSACQKAPVSTPIPAATEVAPQAVVTPTPAGSTIETQTESVPESNLPTIKFNDSHSIADNQPLY